MSRETKFDARPPAVRRWVGMLPTGNLDALARQLDETVARVNTGRVTRAELGHFLEAIGPAATLALDHLESRCGRGLAHDRAGKEAARLSLALTTGILRALARMLRFRESSPWPWRRLQERRRRATALHGTFHYAEYFLRLHRSLHLEPPAGFWQRIHQCWMLVEKENLRGATRRRPGAERATAIEHAYRRLLLVAMLPDDPGPARRDAVREALDGWAGHVTLRRSGDTAPLARVVALDGDQGPRPLVDNANGTLEPHERGLDMRALAQALSEANEGDQALMALLRDSWCAAQKRSEPRLGAQVAVEVVIGLDALYQRAGGIPLPARASFTAGGALAQVSEEERTVPPRAEALVGRLLDQSVQGAFISVPAGGARGISPGVPVAVRVSGEQWRVGVVAHLRRRGKATEFGARFYLRGLLPALAQAAGGAPASVVLGRRAHGGWAVLIPALASLRADEWSLEAGGARMRVSRGEPLCASRHVNVLVVKPLAIEATRPAKQQSAAAPVKSAAPTPKAGDREARIRELMARTGLGREDAAFVVDGERAAG